MPSYGCMHDVGDEDCAKCVLHGILLNDCPYMCEDYEDINGNHPHREYWEQEKRKYMPTSGPKPSDEEIRIDKVMAWIAKRMAPSKIRHPYSSYTLKHYFERDTGEYVTNDEFKTAMYRSGYMPLEGGNALNAHYKVKFRKNEEEGKR